MSATDRGATRAERDAAALAEWLADVLANQPPLTPDQRARIAVLLRPTTRPGAATRAA